MKHTGLLVVLWILVEESICLQITKVTVPTPILVGESGLLECHYLPENDSVYSLKWYLGLHEFYRWTPAENPKVKIFPIRSAFWVQKNESTEGKVRIRNVTLNAEGTLRCEISGEAPEFHTEFKDVDMTVVDLPDSRPIITGENDHIREPLERVVLNCTSPNSKPAAKLSFLINDRKVDKNWVTHYPIIKNETTGLETASVSIRFPLFPRFFDEGYVMVKCIAELLDVYWENSEVLVAGEPPPKASIMASRSSQEISGWNTLVIGSIGILTIYCSYIYDYNL